MSEPTHPIEGIWQMLRAEFAGEQAPELVVQKTELELRAGIYIVRFAGEVSDRGTYEFAGTGTTLSMILRGEAGTNVGRTVPCIYQLVGNRLRMCYGFDNIMPTEFSAFARQQRYLAIYKRHSAGGRHAHAEPDAPTE